MMKATTLGAALLVFGAHAVLAQGRQGRIEVKLDPRTTTAQHVGVVRLGADSMEVVLMGGLRAGESAPCYDPTGKRLSASASDPVTDGPPWRVVIADLATGDILKTVEYAGPVAITDVTNVMINVQLPGAGPFASACNPLLAIIRRRR